MMRSTLGERGTETIVCPSCGSASTHRIGKLLDSFMFSGVPLDAPLTGGWLYQCESCALKFRYPCLNQDEYDRLYRSGAKELWVGKESSRNDMKLVIQYIESNYRNGGVSILDYGCYTGELLSKLPDTFNKFGVEINREAIKQAGEKSITVWSCLDDIPGLALFDIITLVDVVEHFQSPSEIIQKLSKHLSTNGVIIITTGNADSRFWNSFSSNWWYCNYAEHLSFISRKWIERSLIQFNILYYTEFYYDDISFPKKIVNGFFMVFFGAFPRLYESTVFRLAKIFKTIYFVRGRGVTQDHFAVVLKKKNDSAGA